MPGLGLDHPDQGMDEFILLFHRLINPPKPDAK
jgi:hypothetical protein